MDLAPGTNCSPPPLIGVEDETNQECSSLLPLDLEKEMETELVLEIIIVDNLDRLSPDVQGRVRQHILAYLAGYVVRQLCSTKTIQCPLCRLSLFENSADSLDEESRQLLKIKNRKLKTGGLVFSSKSVYLLVVEAQKVFESEIVFNFTHGLSLPSYDVFETLTKMTMSVVETELACDKLFPLFNSGSPTQNVKHKFGLARTVVYRYLKFRSLSYPNVFINAKKPLSTRNRSRKSIQFLGQ